MSIGKTHLFLLTRVCVCGNLSGSTQIRKLRMLICTQQRAWDISDMCLAIKRLWTAVRDIFASIFYVWSNRCHVPMYIYICVPTHSLLSMCRWTHKSQMWKCTIWNTEYACSSQTNRRSSQTTDTFVFPLLNEIILYPCIVSTMTILWWQRLEWLNILIFQLQNIHWTERSSNYIIQSSIKQNLNIWFNDG